MTQWGGGEGYPACRIFSVTQAGRWSHALRHPFYLICVFESLAVCLRLPLLPPPNPPNARCPLSMAGPAAMARCSPSACNGTITTCRGTRRWSMRTWACARRRVRITTAFRVSRWLSAHRATRGERAMRAGNIDGIVSTSALELGVDIGALDVVILNGYLWAAWRRRGSASAAPGVASNRRWACWWPARNRWINTWFGKRRRQCCCITAKPPTAAVRPPAALRWRAQGAYTATARQRTPFGITQARSAWLAR